MARGAPTLAHGGTLGAEAGRLPLALPTELPWSLAAWSLAAWSLAAWSLAAMQLPSSNPGLHFD